MVSDKVLIGANISLVIIAILLTLSFFEVTLPSVGQVRYALDRTEPVCVISWKEKFTVFTGEENLDRCCLEARKQLECVKEIKSFDNRIVEWSCRTGSGNALTYSLNSKAYSYCRQQVFWGRK
ncbi:hypothetical protein HZC30_04715 [Candidatus Woesearchaeota archaeon]|nr:hypothetical protein [Candidatus Woesearchaeota archaeon]